MRETLARAEEVGSPRALALCHHALGAVLYLIGRWDESRAALQRSIEMTRSFGGTFGEVIGEQRLAQLETARGEFGPARERLERVQRIARASKDPMVRAHGLGRVLSTLSLTEYLSGNLHAATRHVARGFATQRVVGDCAGCDVLLYPAAVPVYLALGDIGMAEDAAHKADEIAGAFRSQAWVGSARYLLGLVAAAGGERELARERFEDALARFEQVRQPLEVARVSLALAQVLDDAGRADALRARARELLQHLGAAAPVADST